MSIPRGSESRCVIGKSHYRTNEKHPLHHGVCLSPSIIFKMGGWASSTDIHAPFVTEVLIWVSEVSAAISVVACILRTGGCGVGALEEMHLMRRVDYWHKDLTASF
uniref:Uncharacterized protein n=1 Tax=Anguilla anguilla TaxID=7936 RepID=A0A0E9RN45_ANGAN